MKNFALELARTLRYATPLSALLCWSVGGNAQADIVVGDHLDNGVFLIDETTGAQIGAGPFAAGVSGSQGEAVAYGPDGNLYATYSLPNGNAEVLKYNPITGAQMGDPFIAPGAGGLHYAGDMKWGPDGNLYVANYGDFIGEQQVPGGSVLKYNASGQFLGAIDFGAFSSPSGIAFDRTGNMYVTNWFSNQLMTMNIFNETTPHQLYQGPLLANPSGVTIGPDGNLWVANMDYLGSNGTGWVQTFTTAGDAAGTTATLPPNSFPAGIVFTADHTMLVSSLTYQMLFTPTGVVDNPWIPFAIVTNGANPVNPALIITSPIAGDANADGVVDISDILVVSANWLTGGPTGDVDKSFKVDISDVLLMAANWLHTTYNTGGGPVPVPEPGSLTLGAFAALGGIMLALRTRRRAHA